MRKILLLVWTFTLSCTLLAQQNPASWASLSTLQPGHKIEILDATSKKHSGTFVSVSDTAITLQEAGGDQTISKKDVVRVKLENKHRLRNTLVGAGIGAGIGVPITVAVAKTDNYPRNKTGEATVGIVVGGFFGAVVGAFIPTHNTMYEVK